MEENDLFLRMKQGDKDAFSFLFRKYYPSLCSFATSIIHNVTESEEIVQEMFFLFWERREKIEISFSVKAYLFKSVHNSCLNYIKHKKVRNIYTETILREHTEKDIHFNQFDDADSLKVLIQIAVERLPEKRRQIFKMVKHEQMRYKEVAESLNLSVKTVENQMGKAMAFLRNELREYLPILFFLILFFRAGWGILCL